MRVIRPNRSLVGGQSESEEWGRGFARRWIRTVGRLAWIGIFAATSIDAQEEVLYLTSHFDVDGFDAHGGSGSGGFDGSGGVFPNDAITGERHWEIDSAAFGTLRFLRPPTSEGSKNFVSCRGQVIGIKTKRKFRSLLFVTAAHRAPPSREGRRPVSRPGTPGDFIAAPIRVEYSDGSSEEIPFGASYWDGSAAFGEEAVVRAKTPPVEAEGERSSSVPRGLPPEVARRFQLGRRGDQKSVSLFLVPVPVNGEKTLQSIRLPDEPNLKVAAITLSSRVVSVGEPKPAPEPADVAIFHEAGFPVYEAMGAVDPDAVIRLLARNEIRAVTVGLNHLRDASVVSPKLFPVLVLPHGGLYPAVARDAIAAYRAAGGSVVLAGPPVDFDVVGGPLDTWIVGMPSRSTVENERSPAGGAAVTTLEWPRLAGRDAVAPVGTDLSREWGIAASVWASLDVPPSGNRPVFVLDSPPDGFSLEPVVTLGPSRFAMGIVLSKDSESSSVDIILCPGALTRNGVPVSDLTSELLVRASAYCLLRRGAIDAERWARVAAPFSLDPPEYPTPKTARDVPFGGLAGTSELSGSLYTVDVSDLSRADRILVASAQGLLERAGTAIWLDDGGTFPVADPKDVGERLGLESVERWTVKDVLGALGHRRAVIVDPALPPTLDVASMVASTESVLVAYPGAVPRYELEVAADLRGLFADHVELLEFVRGCHPASTRSEVRRLCGRNG